MKTIRWTKAEDDFYGEEFAYYMKNVRADTKRADAHAFRESLKRFPRLAKFHKKP